jgi:hypothetical protein
MAAMETGIQLYRNAMVHARAATHWTGRRRTEADAPADRTPALTTMISRHHRESVLNFKYRNFLPHNNPLWPIKSGRRSDQYSIRTICEVEAGRRAIKYGSGTKEAN